MLQLFPYLQSCGCLELRRASLGKFQTSNEISLSANSVDPPLASRVFAERFVAWVNNMAMANSSHGGDSRDTIHLYQLYIDAVYVAFTRCFSLIVLEGLPLNAYSAVGLFNVRTTRCAAVPLYTKCPGVTLSRKIAFGKCCSVSESPFCNENKLR